MNTIPVPAASQGQVSKSAVRNFADELALAITLKMSVLCVGLDPTLEKTPPHLIRKHVTKLGCTTAAVAAAFLDQMKGVILAVKAHAVAVKPNLGFWEKYGSAGIAAYEDVIKYAKENGLLVIGDGKRGDGGATAKAYAQGHLGKIAMPKSIQEPCEFVYHTGPMHVDCLTVDPLIGDDCVGQYVKAAKENGNGVVVVVKTSFDPHSKIEMIETARGTHVWYDLAEEVKRWGRDTEGRYGYSIVGAVLGATCPGDAPAMRLALPRSFLLLPGYGAQGGGADGAVAPINDDGLGILVVSARGITEVYCNPKSPFKTNSEDFAESARMAAADARLELNAAIQRKLGKMPW